MRRIQKPKLGAIEVLAGVVLGLVAPGITYALDLTAPFMLETAQVLPPGVRNPRFANLFMSVESKFDASGQVQPLGKPLSKVVRWGDIIRVQKSAIDRGAIRATLNDAKLDLSGSPGSTTGQVNTNFDIKVPVLAWGLSERFTLAVAVPVVNVSVSADTGFIRSQEGQAWIDQLSVLSVEQGNSAAARLNNSVNMKLTALGYQPISSRTISAVGDVQAIGKYALYSDTQNRMSLKSTLIFPTGIRPNADLALDIPTGDGRFQVGASLVYDRMLTRDLRWNAFGGVLGLLPHQLEKRIPTAVDDPLSPDKELLTRHLGGNFSFGTSLNHSFPSLGLVAGAGYNFQFLTKPRYSGTQFSQDRYGFLSDLTPAEVLHSATLMAGFSSVEWYQHKKFFYPMQANLVYSRPISGRNVSTSDVFAGELVLFF